MKASVKLALLLLVTTVVVLTPANSWAQEKSARYGPPLQTFRQTRIDVLTSWQKNTGVKITRGAERLIVQSLIQSRERIRAWQSVKEDSPEELRLITELQREYCFNLADALALQQQQRAQLSRPRLANLQATITRPSMITATEVSRYSFSSLIESIMKLIGPRQVGYIEVSVTPPGGLIYFGTETTPRGITSRSFVLAVGTYLVRVFNKGVPTCAETAEVLAGARVTITCANKTAAMGRQLPLHDTSAAAL